MCVSGKVDLSQDCMERCLMMCVSGEVKTLRRLNSDLPALLDEWATSLFHELDYVREAQNGVRFKKLYGELEVMPHSEFHTVRPMHICQRR